MYAEIIITEAELNDQLLFTNEESGKNRLLMAIFRNASFQEEPNFLVLGKENDFMSFETGQLFCTINSVIVCGIISLFGVMTNAINMIVFCKQGFNNTMTISFMALAISDMCCLLTMLAYGVFMNPLARRLIKMYALLELHPLAAGFPHITFARITGCITAYITAERCLCITAPLAVRTIVTPMRTTFILSVIYLFNFIFIAPVYTSSYFGWKFYPDLNRSLIGALKTADNDVNEGVVFLLHAVVILTTFLCVIVLTIVLVVKLKGAANWRRKAVQSNVQSEAMSTKDTKATSMVIMISVLLITMNTPSIIISLGSFCEPKFGVYGPYKNSFFAMWSFGFVTNVINSSVNIFMYYSMSSKYRDVFNQLFRKSEAK